MLPVMDALGLIEGSEDPQELERFLAPSDTRAEVVALARLEAEAVWAEGPDCCVDYHVADGWFEGWQAEAEFTMDRHALDCFEMMQKDDWMVCILSTSDPDVLASAMADLARILPGRAVH